MLSSSRGTELPGGLPSLSQPTTQPSADTVKPFAIESEHSSCEEEEESKIAVIRDHLS